MRKTGILMLLLFHVLASGCSAQLASPVLFGSTFGVFRFRFDSACRI